jgi:hypothetical protein
MKEDTEFQHDPIDDQLFLLQQALDYPDLSVYKVEIASYVSLVAKNLVINLRYIT